MFPCFHGWHLLEQKFSNQEYDRGKESDDSNECTIITSAWIIVVETNFFVGFVVKSPALWRYATKNNDGEKLQQKYKNE